MGDGWAPAAAEFFWYDGLRLPEEVQGRSYDVALSLDVVFHLLEDELFESYMRHLFLLAREAVVIAGVDVDDPLAGILHMRHHHFTRWVREHEPEWALEWQSPIEGKKMHTSCFAMDEVMQALVRVHHGDERLKASGGRGGRGRGRGRGGRGRDGRGGGWRGS